MNANSPIALLTDFGLADAYVGIMKGVMAAISPSSQFIDISHAIEPQNVRQAAYILATSYRYFPKETVFLVVVDPGVGTARDPIAVATGHGTYVAPDNGVLSYVLKEVAAHQAAILANPEYLLPEPSQTFHGRDIFSPAAAYLASGVPIDALGPPASKLVSLPDPVLEMAPGRMQGEVLHIDHFGNVITSIGAFSWMTDRLVLTPRFGAGALAEPVVVNPATCLVHFKDTPIGRIHPTYGAVNPGTMIALVGSSGHLEIGINQGSAAEKLGAAIGDPITLHYANDTHLE